MSSIRYQISSIIYQISDINYQISSIIYHVSDIMYQISSIRYQMSVSTISYISDICHPQGLVRLSLCKQRGADFCLTQPGCVTAFQNHWSRCGPIQVFLPWDWSRLYTHVLSWTSAEESEVLTMEGGAVDSWKLATISMWLDMLDKDVTLRLINDTFSWEERKSSGKLLCR